MQHGFNAVLKSYAHINIEESQEHIKHDQGYFWLVKMKGDQFLSLPLSLFFDFAFVHSLIFSMLSIYFNYNKKKSRFFFFF